MFGRPKITEAAKELSTVRRLNATFMEVAIHLALVGFLVYWTFILVSPFIPIVVWSVVLSVALYPVFDWLAKAIGGRPRLAAIIVTIVGFLIVVGPATWLGLGLAEGLRVLVGRIEGRQLFIPPPAIDVKDWPLIGQPVYDYWLLASTNLRSALTDILPQLKPFGEILIETMSSAGAGTLKFLASVIIAGFLFIRGPHLVATMKKLAHRIDSEHGEGFVMLAAITIRAVSRGVIGVSLLEAVIAGVGMSLAGVPFASVLTLVILVLGIIQLGPLVIVVPLVIWTWATMSAGPALAFTMCMAAVYLVELLLKPFVLARGLTTPMLVIFIGVIGGILAHGIPGLFAGPIVLAVAWELANAWINGDEEHPLVSGEKFHWPRTKAL